MTKNKSNDWADEIGHDIKEAINDLGENEDVVKMKKQAKEVADVATEFIREYPLQTVVGAAVVGLAIGYLLGNRKQ